MHLQKVVGTVRVCGRAASLPNPCFSMKAASRGPAAQRRSLQRDARLAHRAARRRLQTRRGVCAVGPDRRPHPLRTPLPLPASCSGSQAH